jgi:hypothetical protein
MRWQMLRIKNEYGVELAVKFFHGEVSGAFLDLAGVPPKRRYWVATADGNGHEVGRGESVCHPGDRYVRAVGRKLAFERLLSQMDLPREARRAAWEKFFSYGKQPKK